MKTKVFIAIIFITMGAIIYKMAGHIFFLSTASPVMIASDGVYPEYIGPNNGIVKAEGTWFIKGEKQEYPLQVSTINCLLERGCTGSTAIVMNGMLHSFIDYYKILEWDETHVSIVNDSSMCVDYIYNINFPQRKATGMRVLKNKSASCAGIKPVLHIELRNGIDAQEQYKEDKEKEFFDKLWMNFKFILLY